MKTWLFTKRNLKEMVRDPLLYVFCLGAPVAMLLLFGVVNHFAAGTVIPFLPLSLIPGLLMFSFTFIMLMESLLVSKDRTTAFLKRLFSSPLRAADFVIGYALPGVLLGALQAVVCIAAGFFAAKLTGEAYFGIGEAALLLLSQLPMLLFCVFLGILLGTCFNDKSAPGVISVLISASGVLGGAWMPLESMGSFADFCRVLPFYPSAALGRMITGASYLGGHGEILPYTFRENGWLFVGTVAVYLVAAAVFAFFVFARRMQNDS